MNLLKRLFIRSKIFMLEIEFNDANQSGRLARAMFIASRIDELQAELERLR